MIFTPTAVKSDNAPHVRSLDGDVQQNIPVEKLFAGKCYISAPREHIMISTILGSCVSACIHDPAMHLGGMNHFLVPGEETHSEPGQDSARLGVFAMKQLIEQLLARGAQRDRLEVKLFGGGNVTSNSRKIGSQNATFARHYLRHEKLQVTCEDLEGELPRRVHFFPYSGKVMVRKLYRAEDLAVVEVENAFKNALLHLSKSDEHMPK